MASFAEAIQASACEQAALLPDTNEWACDVQVDRAAFIRR
jgi:hypothetical protein